MRDPETGRLDESGFGEKEILGYTDEWSVRPGDELDFRVSCKGPDVYRAALVELICADRIPDGPKYREREVGSPIDGEHEGRVQSVHPGSYVVVPDADGVLAFEKSFTLQCLFSPTTPARKRETLLSRWDDDAGAGYCLSLDADGRPQFRVGDGTEVTAVSVEQSLSERWYAATVAYDGERGRIELRVATMETGKHPGREQWSARETTTAVAPAGRGGTPFYVGAVARADADGTYGGETFNGKIERPRVFDTWLSADDCPAPTESLDADSPSPVAEWDFAANVSDDGFDDPDRVVDVGPHGLDAETVNQPARSVPGHDWTGDVHDFVRAPDQYGAIHFHETDLVDAGWESDFTLTVPPKLDSGVYAVRLRTDDDEYYVPFAVRPERGDESDVALLLPTNTYLAYGNQRMFLRGGSSPQRTHIVDDGYGFLCNHREFGASFYDTHVDGHGVMFSSRKRPLVNISPKAVYGGGPPSHLSHLAADLYLVDWLKSMGFEYDTITDEDLHVDGEEALEPYNLVVTGNHAEYYSKRQLDLLKEYVRSGGRMICPGGNNFYWAIAYHPDCPQIIETRRGETGTEPWKPEPGEVYHQFGGDKSGLWRRRGEPPQQLTGVGFCAQWEINASHYRRTPESYDEAVAFLFDGVSSETLGDDGLLGRGAAGQEIDRYDPSLGSPEDAYVLASSENHSQYALRATEEYRSSRPRVDGASDSDVHADLVYYRTETDGAVLTTGSMSWVGALPCDDYDNAASKLMANAVEWFGRDGDLPSATE